MRTNEQQDFLTVKEVADLMRVKPLTIYRMLTRKELPAVKFGKSWRISKLALDAKLKL